MEGVRRVYDGVLNALAALAGVLLALMSVVIVYDACLRALRLGAPIWAIDVTGIALVYITFLASPWLLREQGHVFVEVLVARLAPKGRAALGRAVCAACALICIVLAFRAVGVVIGGIGETDASAIETPRWLRFLPVPIGFFFLFTEFCRLLVSGRLFDVKPGPETREASIK